MGNDTNLNIQVWDWDAIGSDDFLGLCKIDLSELKKGKKEISGWFALEKDPNKPKIKVTGDVIQIRISFHLFTFLIIFLQISIKVTVHSQKQIEKRSSNTGANKEIGLRLSNAKQDLAPFVLSSMELDQIPELDCSDLENIQLNLNNLTEFPSNQIKSAAQTLQILNLSGNQIKSFPSSAGIFNHLTELWLNGNQITSLAPEIAKIQPLEKLNLANNALTSLPNTIGYLKNLDDLNLMGNQLESLPDSIGNLWKLEVLDLSCNGLKSLPEEITYLTRVMEINLGSNNLVQLPQAIGRLSRMVSLNIADNNLRALPVSM